MFEKYIIDPATVRNIGPAEAPTGFAFQSKLGYYRGLTLSMIEELAVSVDGRELERAAVRFDEGRGPLTLDEMATTHDRRWPFGTAATVLVDLPGGLPAGEHEIGLRQKLRISYLPFPSVNEDRKTVVL